MARVPAKLLRRDPVAGDVWAPLIVVRVTLPAGSVDLQAIVDSGSDNTIIPIEVVQGLGVDWSKLAPAPAGKGAGGQFEKRVLAADVAYAGHAICDHVEVAAVGALPVVLLGRSDFFRKFRVTFDWTTNPPWVEFEAPGGPPTSRQQRRAQERRAHR